MFERFASATRETVRRAAELAETEHASLVEVEHLLTALVDPATEAVGAVLMAAGITPEAIRAARDREFHSALALVGVETREPSPPPARRHRRGRTTKFGTSATLALERTLEIATQSGQRRITNESLILAIISAEVGITPRLLAELGTDREQLGHLLQQAT